MPISVLNAGHGDVDTGAVANGLIERDINYNVAVIAKQLMEYNGITVPPIIRGSDLNEVIRQVNLVQGANLAHSIHHNAGYGDGYECIHSIYYGKGTDFAKIVEEEFAKLGQNAHGTGDLTKLSSDGTHDYYGFIRDTDPPAVISEYAFIDSQDYTAIDTSEEQYAEGEAIAKAHCRYYGITYRSPKEQQKTQGDDTILDVAVLLYSKEDYWAGYDVAVKNGNCAIFTRPADHSVPADAMSAKKLIVVGGGTTGHPNELLLSGATKYDTANVVGKYLG